MIALIIAGSRPTDMNGGGYLNSYLYLAENVSTYQSIELPIHSELVKIVVEFLKK